MADSELRRLKRKRSTERTKATRFTTLINEFTASTPLDDDYQHYRRPLVQLIQLDNAIQDILRDNEYTADVETCGEDISSAKREILKATRDVESRLTSSGEKLNLAVVPSASMTVRPPFTHLVKLSPTKTPAVCWRCGNVVTILRAV
jgi:hypothetical protein